jgi:hypothetical protein
MNVRTVFFTQSADLDSREIDSFTCNPDDAHAFERWADDGGIDGDSVE